MKTKGLITELPPKERAAMRKRIKTAASVLLECEARMQRYLAGEDNIFKTTTELKWLQEVVKKTLGEIGLD